MHALVARAFGLGCPCAFLFGCTETPPEAARSVVSEYDSAGVRVVITPGTQARAALGWVVSGPEVVIGCAEGPEEYIFSRISGAAVLADGTVAVVDERSALIRLFEPQGRAIMTVGRRGEGPGEFRLPRLAEALPDSLVIFDQRLQRLTTVGSDGRIVRTSAPIPGLRGLPVGLFDGRIVSVSRPVIVRSEPGPFEVKTTFMLFDRSGEVARFEDFPGALDFRSFHGAEVEGVGRVPRYMHVPFDADPSAAVSDGTLYITPGEGAAVIEGFDSSTALVKRWVVDEALRPVTPEPFHRYVERRVGEAVSPTNERDDYSRMPRPEHVPAFRSLRSDDSGGLWAGLFEAEHDPPRRWMVFDSTGAAKGVVTTPEDVDIHQIGNSFILGVTTDELGVGRVVRFGLDRSPVAGTGNAPESPAGADSAVVSAPAGARTARCSPARG